MRACLHRFTSKLWFWIFHNNNNDNISITILIWSTGKYKDSKFPYSYYFIEKWSSLMLLLIQYKLIIAQPLCYEGWLLLRNQKLLINFPFIMIFKYCNNIVIFGFSSFYILRRITIRAKTFNIFTKETICTEKFVIIWRSGSHQIEVLLFS